MINHRSALLITAALSSAPAVAQGAAPLIRERLQAAVFVMLPGAIQGNANLISKDQQVALVAAMVHDSINALKRRYPGAQIVSDVNTPNAVRITPVLIAPGALVPWATVGAQWTLQAPGQKDLTVAQSFNLFEAYSHKDATFNYMFDKVAGQLP